MPTTAYNKAANEVQTVGLAPPGIPIEPAVQIMVPVGANFGLVGGLIEAGRATAASKELQDILSRANYDYRTDLRDSLALAFTGAPFLVTPLEGTRPTNERFKFLAKCPKNPDSDACLDVFITYVGYMAAGATTDYVPTLRLTARMVRNQDGAVLFQDEIHYNSVAGAKVIVVQPSDRFRFKDRDAMKANPQRVTAGIQEAIRAVTNELARQFM